MAKDKTAIAAEAALRAPVIAIRLFEKEIDKSLEERGTALARTDAQHLSSLEAYAILLFLSEFAEAGLSEKKYKALLARHGLDTPGHLRNYPMLSQTVVFELFDGLDISRESIRRLLLMMAEYGLIERISKGPPFPDRITISKTGRKLMNRVGKGAAKEIARGGAFSYL